MTTRSSRVAFEHPENRGVLAFLGAPSRIRKSLSDARSRPECAPEEVEEPYLRLGTHPELVERLWEELTRDLPRDCRWVVHGAPALVHPESGVIFGFAGGTSTYALRLPQPALAEARSAGWQTVHEYPAYSYLGIAASRLDLAELGPDWILGAGHPAEPSWCLAAYQHAGRA